MILPDWQALGLKDLFVTYRYISLPIRDPISTQAPQTAASHRLKAAEAMGETVAPVLDTVERVINEPTGKKRD